MAIVQAPLAPAVARPVSPTSRDHGIDLVRALCVAGVVLLHALMVGVTIVDGAPLFENASAGTGWIVPVSWLLQVMPLFFVIGGFSGALSHRRNLGRGGTATAFVAARVHRLLRPAAATIAIVGSALLLLSATGVPADLVAVAGFRYGQPLWFLAVFLLCQALLPALLLAHDRRPVLSIALLVVSAIAVDTLRAITAIDALGFLNLAFVWLALQQLGFFVADGRIDAFSRRTRTAMAVGAVGVLLLAFAGGLYSPDLIENVNPPTTALLLVGLAHTCALSLHRGRITALARERVPAAFRSFVNRRAMTIYLWHMPVLLGMAGVTALVALSSTTTLAAPGSLAWWLERPLWLATALGLTALVALPLSRAETRPAPETTACTLRVTLAVLSGLVGVVLLLVAGTTPATAALAVVLLVTALRLASHRIRWAPRRRPQTRVRSAA